MLSNPTISVLMSVYNGEPYLAEAIESILSQTFSDFEFIIINDGSTDNSLETIKHYQAEDNRIVLISRENKGLIASLNEGIEVAKGKYIARMDADDVSFPARLEEQYAYMEANGNVVVCGSWIEQIYKDGKKPKVVKYFENDKEIKTQLLFGCPFAHPSVLMRKDILIDNNIRYDKEYLHAEDYQLWTELSRYGEFANLQIPLIQYRYLDSSITRLADKQDVQRKAVLSKIYQNAFENHGISFDGDTVGLIYEVSNNTRLGFSKITVDSLIKLVELINSEVKGLTGLNLEMLRTHLSKRFVWYFLLKKQPKAIFNKYFWHGLVSIFESKLWTKKHPERVEA